MNQWLVNWRSRGFKVTLLVAILLASAASVLNRWQLSRWKRELTVGLVTMLLLAISAAGNEVTRFLNSSRVFSPPSHVEFRIAATDWVVSPERNRAEYRVRRGDTVCEIAELWRTPCRDVMQANSGRFADEFSLPVGMALYLPLASLADER